MGQIDSMLISLEEYENMNICAGYKCQIDHCVTESSIRVCRAVHILSFTHRYIYFLHFCLIATHRFEIYIWKQYVNANEFVFECSTAVSAVEWYFVPELLETFRQYWSGKTKYQNMNKTDRLDGSSMVLPWWQRRVHSASLIFRMTSFLGEAIVFVFVHSENVKMCTFSHCFLSGRLFIRVYQLACVNCGLFNSTSVELKNKRHQNKSVQFNLSFFPV